MTASPNSSVSGIRKSFDLRTDQINPLMLIFCKRAITHLHMLCNANYYKFFKNCAFCAACGLQPGVTVTNGVQISINLAYMYL